MLTAAAKQKIQQALDLQSNSIPVDVRIKDLPGDHINVMEFPAQCGLLSETELELTSMTASEIVRRIACRELTSEECARAFIKRAGIATQLLNCCTEILGDEAIARAKELDNILQKTGKTVGPLHGLPMSFKEHIMMKGKSSHVSYVAWIGDISTTHSLIFDVMLEAGVVPICRTPQPQSVMHLETNSNIYGHTVNPYHRKRTPGGSSGGESATIAFRGSPIGVGSDIGGSIRGPAALCGLYGFKPTSLRVPAGTRGLHKGRESILSTMGPLGQSRNDMCLWMSACLSGSPWLREPSLVPIPWREINLQKENLVIAVMWSDGVVRPLPPITRALNEITAKLRAANIKLVDWVPKDHDASWDIISSLYYMNNAEDEKAMWRDGGEFALPLTEWVITQPGVKYNTYDENDALLIRRNQYKTDYALHWLSLEKQYGCKIDAILCPAAPGPAPKLGTSKYWSYTSVWNLLDYPGVVFPVTSVRKDDVEQYTAGHPSEKELWNDWDPVDAEGLPIALQLVGRRYEDEKVLEVLRLIELAMA